jgi:hypothetical protein
MRLRLGALAPVLVVTAACSGSSDGAATTGESWCDVVAASNTLDDEFDAVDAQDSAALQAVVEKIGDLGRRFRATAPGQIEAQVRSYADTNDRLVEIFAAADFDVEALDGAAVEAAIRNVDDVATEIDVFTVAECGVPLGPDDT